MWNYIYYITYLNYKEKTEYNGNESYVWTTAEKNELSWFPINRSLIIFNFLLILYEKRALAIKDEEEDNAQINEIYEDIFGNVI